MAELLTFVVFLAAAAVGWWALQNRGPGNLASPIGYWVWACAAILAAGFCLTYTDFRWSVPLGYALGTLYPALLLSGALAYADRSTSPLLLVGALVYGLGRGVIASRGDPVLAHGLALVVEPPLMLAAAWFAHRPLRGQSQTFAQRGLPIAFVGVAVLEAITTAMSLGESLPSAPARAPWVIATPTLLALQIAAASQRTESALRRARRHLEQRVAERTAELRMSEERYRTVSELSTDYGFGVRLDPDFRVTFEWATEGMERTTGFSAEELSGEGWFAMLTNVGPDAVVRLLERIMRGELQDLTIPIRTKGGEERWISVRFAALDPEPDGSIRMLGAGRDVTERRRAREEARRAELHLQEVQRLESLGLMAGGLAHDFNNMLTVIRGNTRLAQQDIGRGHDPGERLDRIQAAADHAADLTELMLRYSGRGALALRAVDLSRLVARMRDLLRASVSEKCSFETDLASTLPPVDGDEVQLRQVLINLVHNASEAIGEAEGHILLRTGSRPVDAATLASAFGAPDPVPGEYVFVEVRDDGPGMTSEEAVHVFEPFFTTKPSGRGLGLAAVLGIVRSHRGWIRVESATGQGACFEVLLPRATTDAAVLNVPQGAAPHAAPQGGCVLFVDDDESVREVGAEFLRRAGYDVLLADGGREALDCFQRRGDEIDVVVLDLMMPDLAGEEVFHALRSLRRDVPVVMTSGYDRERAAERIGDGPLTGFLSKPYGPEELVRSVAEGMTARAAAADD